MPTLPTPGGDYDSWGTELNEFLEVMHEADGDLRPFHVDATGGAGDDGYAEIIKDTAPLNYVGTRSAFVLQHRDESALAVNGIAQGAMFQFIVDADGAVSLGPAASYSVWAGLWSVMHKHGDASGHCFTGTGELHDVGAGGYNELGGFQGEFTNMSSTLGNMSGVEIILKDSPDGGTTSFDTQMSGITSRLAKYNSGRTNKWTASFLASSEGTVGPDAILYVNDVGTQPWVAGIDLTNATLSSGIALKLANNQNLSWHDASGTPRPIFYVDASNVTNILPASAAANVSFRNFAATTAISVQGTTGDLTFGEGVNIDVGSTTGTKIALLPSDKLGFYGFTPIVQPTGVAVTAGGIHAALVSLGLIAA
jgi:hypothetical protein